MKINGRLTVNFQGIFVALQHIAPQTGKIAEIV
jgi:hypothetical protein